MTKTFVVARNYAQYKGFLLDNKLNMPDFVHVTSKLQLQGLENIKVVFLEGYRLNPNWQRLLVTLLERGFEPDYQLSTSHHLPQGRLR